MDVLVQQNRLEGAFLEGEVEKFHIRPQEYEFWDESVTGPGKIREDQKIVTLLKEGKFSLNYRPYLFGAYPYISRNKEVSSEEFP